MGPHYDRIFEHLSKFLPLEEAAADSREVLNFFSDKHSLKEPAVSLKEHELTELGQLIEQVVTRRSKGEPLAYILGEKGFYNDIFFVSPAVLIPRADTEEVVNVGMEIGLSKLKTKCPLRLLDIGTGSGCIGLSLAKHLVKVQSVLVDVSEEALKIAKANSVRLGLGSSDTEFQAVSIFDFVANQKSFRKKFDIIVSNPPYIEVGDPNVEQSVQDFEPKVALFTEMSGYRFYDFYSKHAWDWLEDDGTLICEIGVGMETQISKMFSTLYWKELKFFKDTSGRTRVFSVSKK